MSIKIILKLSKIISKTIIVMNIVRVIKKNLKKYPIHYKKE